MMPGQMDNQCCHNNDEVESTLTKLRSLEDDLPPAYMENLVVEYSYKSLHTKHLQCYHSRPLHGPPHFLLDEKWLKNL